MAITAEEARELKTAMDNTVALGDMFEKKVGDIDQLKKNAEENQKALDDLISWKKQNKDGITSSSKKTFGESFAEKIQSEFDSKQSEIKSAMNDRKGKYVFELKSAGTMTISSNLTGDGVATYSGTQGIIPAQKVNFRDLISTVNSPTGTYVQYRETGGEGAIDVQTEGSAKSKIDYDLTEVKTVGKYIAGVATFSKQLMFNLPFLQNTLVRMLLRDFYKKENNYFYTSLAANATGSYVSAETDDIKQLIDVINLHLDADFNASYVLVKHKELAILQKLLYGNGWNLPGGGVVSLPNGSITISGVPIVPVSWMPSDKAVIIDRDFIERIETDSLRVEFSYENNDNFEKNLVTARVECFEELNLVRSDAHAVIDCGNES